MYFRILLVIWVSLWCLLGISEVHLGCESRERKNSQWKVGGSSLSVEIWPSMSAKQRQVQTSFQSILFSIHIVVTKSLTSCSYSVLSKQPPSSLPFHIFVSVLSKLIWFTHAAWKIFESLLNSATLFCAINYVWTIEWNFGTWCCSLKATAFCNNKNK